MPDIRPATDSDRPQLAELLFRHYPAEEHAALAAALTGVAWVAEREGKIVGACAADMQPGQIGYITGPGLSEEEPAATGDELLRAAHQWCDERDARLLQSLLPSAEHPAAEFLRRAGYAHASDLLYLVAQTNAPSPRPPRGSLIAYQDPVDHPRLAELLARTYVGSLDCSHPADARSIDETLAGYAATGESGTSLWFFLQDDAGGDAGCLLLADYPALRQWELVYLGLVPEARGHGYGQRAVAEALARAKEAGRERLVLAVDEANLPAVALYARAGFEAWNRRAVFLRGAPL